MCCGVGNLEVKHSNPRNIYMSTLDEADVDVMKATKTCVAATRFQYDYLNDDIKSPSPQPSPVNGRGSQHSEDKDGGGSLPSPAGGRGTEGEGLIDYSLTNKVPLGLRQAIAEGKKILVLINPPYAEVSSSVTGDNKTGVAATKLSKTMGEYGYSKRELFTQFMARITREIPTATLAMFSTFYSVHRSRSQRAGSV